MTRFLSSLAVIAMISGLLAGTARADNNCRVVNGVIQCGVDGTNNPPPGSRHERSGTQVVYHAYTYIAPIRCEIADPDCRKAAVEANKFFDTCPPGSLGIRDVTRTDPTPDGGTVETPVSRSCWKAGTPGVSTLTTDDVVGAARGAASAYPPRLTMNPPAGGLIGLKVDFSDITAYAPINVSAGSANTTVCIAAAIAHPDMEYLRADRNTNPGETPFSFEKTFTPLVGGAGGPQDIGIDFPYKGLYNVTLETTWTGTFAVSCDGTVPDPTAAGSYDLGDFSQVVTVPNYRVSEIKGILQ